MNKAIFQNVSDHRTLAEKLGKRVIEVLSDAIAKRGTAYLVVSGGSTPRALFKYLSKQPLAWEKVTITLADERCVAREDQAANANLVKEELLKGHASAARFVDLLDSFSGEEPGIDDQIDAGLRLLALPRYDMVLLGMGNDGHTASIFPDAINRDCALDANSHSLALLTDPKTVGPKRITQSLSRLLKTRHLVVHFTGSAKTLLLNDILKKPCAKKWPISAFLTQSSVPVEVYTSEVDAQSAAA